MIASHTKFVPPAKSVSEVKEAVRSRKAHNTCELIKFQAVCDAEKEQLVGDGDKQGDGEVIVIQCMNHSHDNGIFHLIDGECSVLQQNRKVTLRPLYLALSRGMSANSKGTPSVFAPVPKCFTTCISADSRGPSIVPMPIHLVLSPGLSPEPGFRRAEGWLRYLTLGCERALIENIYV